MGVFIEDFVVPALRGTIIVVEVVLQGTRSLGNTNEVSLTGLVSGLHTAGSWLEARISEGEGRTNGTGHRHYVQAGLNRESRRTGLHAANTHKRQRSSEFPDDEDTLLGGNANVGGVVEVFVEPALRGTVVVEEDFGDLLGHGVEDADFVSLTEFVAGLEARGIRGTEEITDGDVLADANGGTSGETIADVGRRDCRVGRF